MFMYLLSNQTTRRKQRKSSPRLRELLLPPLLPPPPLRRRAGEREVFGKGLELDPGRHLPLLLLSLPLRLQRTGCEEGERKGAHHLGRPASQTRHGQGRPTNDKAASHSRPLRQPQVEAPAASRRWCHLSELRALRSKRSTAARVDTTSAVVDAFVAEQLPRAADSSITSNAHKKKQGVANLSEPVCGCCGGCGGCG